MLVAIMIVPILICAIFNNTQPTNITGSAADSVLFWTNGQKSCYYRSYDSTNQLPSSNKVGLAYQQKNQLETKKKFCCSM